MQKRIITSLSLIITSLAVADVYAVAPGLYLGLMAGPATNSASTLQAQVQGSAATTKATPKSNQFGSRVFMGYKINQFAGIEGGLTFISKIGYNTHDVETCGGTTVRVRDIDVVGKGTLPLGNVFDVFAKGGVAYIYETTAGALNPTGNPTTCGKNKYESKARPTASIGASVTMGQSWVADISWNRIMAGGSAGNVDLFAIGISYHIVSQYCGQFLCDD